MSRQVGSLNFERLKQDTIITGKISETLKTMRPEGKEHDQKLLEDSCVKPLLS